jgi:hypothetical protein
LHLVLNEEAERCVKKSESYSPSEQGQWQPGWKWPQIKT